jgi:hypothetical protein
LLRLIISPLMSINSPQSMHRREACATKLGAILKSSRKLPLKE